MEGSMVMAAVRAAVKTQSAMRLDGPCTLVGLERGSSVYISCIQYARTNTHVSMEELWYIPIETKPALRFHPDLCHGRKGPANGSGKAWFEVILDEPCISVLLRVLPPQVSENTTRLRNLHWLHTQPSSSATPAQWRNQCRSLEDAYWSTVGYGHDRLRLPEQDCGASIRVGVATPMEDATFKVPIQGRWLRKGTCHFSQRKRIVDFERARQRREDYDY